ncbi:ATP-dependent Clp protease proteolytic subunit [Pseudonocardia phyllosphaerae]|uniref:ATP-dependent Clp protease proteolytic subunit n=1 Tax=Pseudonocardia phyllosphaerae TaxID=3390502 RepID=UPI00397BDF48
MPVPAFDPGSLADQLLGRRIVLLARELDDDVAAETCSRLLLLAAEDPHRPVTLQILSPGGSPVAAMTVHDTMRTLGPDVATVAAGSLAGPVPFLVAAGTPGRRTALPHAMALPTGDGPVSGSHPGDVRVRAEHLTTRRTEIEELTNRYCGAPLPGDARERWLSAQDMLRYGIVDEIRGSAQRMTGRADS